MSVQSITLGTSKPYVAEHRELKRLRPWQADAFANVMHTKRVFLAAQVGSGRTLMIKLRAGMHTAAGAFDAIIVPQVHLRAQFCSHETVYRTFDDVTRFNGAEARAPTVAELNELLTQRARRRGRIVITTHPAFVAAMTGVKRVRRVSLFVDEAHALEDGSESDGPTNGLAAAVRVFLESEAPVLLATATPFRSTDTLLLPADVLATFKRVEHGLVDHVESLPFPITLQALGGDSRKVLRLACSQSERSTVVWLPPVGSASMAALECDKFGARDLVLDAASWAKGDVVDLVDDSSPKARAERLARLRERSLAGDAPRLIVACEIGKAGLDIPQLTAAITLHAGTRVQLLQQLGRLLRAHPGKAGARFVIVVNVQADDPESVERFLDATCTLLALGVEAKLPRHVRGTAESFERTERYVRDRIDQALCGTRNGPADDDRDVALADALCVVNGDCAVVSQRLAGIVSATCELSPAALARHVSDRVSVDRARIIELWHAGERNLSAIARAVGCSCSAVSRVLVEAGFRTPKVGRRVGHAESLREAIAAVRGGVGVDAAAKQHGVSNKPLAKACRAAAVVVTVQPSVGAAERLATALASFSGAHGVTAHARAHGLAPYTFAEALCKAGWTRRRASNSGRWVPQAPQAMAPTQASL